MTEPDRDDNGRWQEEQEQEQQEREMEFMMERARERDMERRIAQYERSIELTQQENENG